MYIERINIRGAETNSFPGVVVLDHRVTKITVRKATDVDVALVADLLHLKVERTIKIIKSHDVLLLSMERTFRKRMDIRDGSMVTPFARVTGVFVPSLCGTHIMGKITEKLTKY